MLYDPSKTPYVAPVEIEPPVRVAPQDEWRRSLHQAADILEHKGWTTGAFANSGRHCMLGAVYLAITHGKETSAAWLDDATPLSRLERYVYSRHGCSVISYNDSCDASRNSCITMIRECANQK